LPRSYWPTLRRRVDSLGLASVLPLSKPVAFLVGGPLVLGGWPLAGRAAWANQRGRPGTVTVFAACELW